MALETQLVPVTFNQGVDTKTDPKQVKSKLISLQNGYFKTLDEIRKRNGYTALSTSIDAGGSFTSSVGLAAYQSELLTFDGFNLYSYSPSLSKWSSKGTAEPQVGLSTSSAYMNGLSLEFQDSTYHAASGLQLVTWYDAINAGSSYSIIDQATGDKLVNGTVIGNASASVKTLALGSYLVMIYFDYSTNHLRYRAIDTTNPTVFPAAVDLATTINTTHPTFDATVINGRIYCAFNNTAGGSGGVSVLYLDAALGISAAFSSNVGDAQVCINVFTDTSNNVWVVYHCTAASRIQGFVRDFALTSSVIGTTALFSHAVTAITGVFNTGSSPISATVYYQVSGTINQFQFAAAGGSVDQVIIRGVTLESKAWVYNTRTYFWTAFASNYQATYFLVDCTAAILRVVVGKLAPAEAGAGLGNTTFLPEVTAISAGVYQWAYLQLTREEVFSGTADFFYGVSLSETSFLEPVQTAVQAKVLHFTGGILSMYDSGSVVEHSFHLYPEISASASTATTGGSMAPGTYSFVAVYEWTDSQGQVYRSTPSPVPCSKVVPAGTSTNTVTVTAPMLRLTRKSSSANPVRVTFYRTTANGTLYFLDGVTTNDTSNDTATYVSTLSDANLITQRQLYTDSGEVENLPVPAPLAMFTYKDRLAVIPAETPCSWWFSKEILPGVPVEFSDLLVQNETTTDGPLVAGAQMDDKLVLLKQNTVYYVVGNGPASNGSNNDFTPAQQVVSETGCNNAASVVLTPDGLMYQSPKGIYLLDRSLKDHYIGADVEAYNAYTVTSAKMITGTTQVRFTLSNGTALVWDYLVKQWAVWTAHSAVGAAVYQGAYTYIGATGVAMQETANHFTDNGAFIQLYLLTAWMKLAGLQGFQRIYGAQIVGDYYSAHHLNVQVAYDYNSTVRQTVDITADSTVPYQYGIQLARQKCQAIQFQIEDTQASNFGQGLSLSSLQLEVGVKKGPFRLAPNRSFG